MSDVFQRRSPRLQGYDYTQEGAYFVTICTFQREELFGEISDGAMRLSALGEIAGNCWTAIPTHFLNIELDLFVVMPNHIHGILLILKQRQDDEPKTTQFESVSTKHVSSLQKPTSKQRGVIGAKAGSLGASVGSYKSAVTREINTLLGIRAPRVWQPRYHDHIIRSDGDLQRLRDYVANNPAKWEQDKFFVPRQNDICL